MQPDLTIVALSLWLIVLLGLTCVVYALISMWKENRFGWPLRGIVWFTLAIVGSCAVIALLAGYGAAVIDRNSVNTRHDKWANAMAAFEQQDREMPPSPGGIVFVGSSSIRLWDLARYFPNMPVVNRGLGGSQIIDSVNYVDLLILGHKPRTVVFYAGENDLAGGKTAQQVADDFRAFVAKVHAALPATRIAFIGMKPSILWWKLAGTMREANALIRTYCGNDDRLAYIDVDGPMLGWDEKPRKDLFVEDGLHLTPKGYELWTLLVRPFLE